MIFYKYQGTGNDFILLDNREGNISLTNPQVAFLCNRHFGIGADGLMLLELAEGYDFKMVYYNSNGRESTMCGNGGRCMAAFAQYLGIIQTETNFIAIDGAHKATIADNGRVNLHMVDVPTMTIEPEYTIINTGSPHYVLWVEHVQQTDVYNRGKSIRYNDAFKPGGVNVNFVQQGNDQLIVRTYERGVEDETLSCGTGVTAAAIASVGRLTGTYTIPVETPGGHLEVSFVKTTPFSAHEVVLTGPAKFVFKGEIELK
ncbi:MAG: diaminopimelate epimerase [Bacteroidota bacterium]